MDALNKYPNDEDEMRRFYNDKHHLGGMASILLELEFRDHWKNLRLLQALLFSAHAGFDANSCHIF